MSDLFLGQLLEHLDFASLRIDDRHHVTDRFILARRIHSLKDHHQSVRLMRHEISVMHGKIVSQASERLAGVIVVTILSHRARESLAQMRSVVAIDELVAVHG